MSLEYNVRYPLTAKITEMDIKDAARSWIEGSRWYKFTETNFPVEEKEGTLIQVDEGRTAWFKHFEYQKNEGGEETRYYGYRLETTDSDNRKWRAEAVFELGSTQRWMYVNNACYINHIDEPAIPMGGCRYPRIIRVMQELGLLEPDHGLTIGQSHIVSEMSPDERNRLKEIMEKRSRLDLPMICIHLRGSLDWINMVQSGAAVYMARTAHVFLCMNEEDEGVWKQLVQGCGWIDKSNLEMEEDTAISAFELLLPQTGVCWRKYFQEEENDWRLIDRMMDVIERVRPLLPADTPSWDWLHLQNTIVPNSAETESYNLIMTEALAARLQEARKQHHLTQGELAEMTGSSLILISRLERLQTKKVKRELIYAIEKTLGLEKNELARLGSSKTESMRTMENGSDAAIRENGTGKQGVPNGMDDERADARFCHMCGTLLKPQSRFCHHCGVGVI